MVEHMNKFRYQHAFFSGFRAHREFVAEIAHGGKAHPGYAQVFAQRRDVFHVELIERDDAVDFLISCREADRIDQTGKREVFRHEEHFVNRFARPIAVAQLFHGE